ncbi:CorA family divalent cation transporter [Phenylobacterium sp.]|uniref:CorA family divalent cation transporter n=1 Tax=Phenylobacterium sp. TaxID=1871053 RepID=UPI001218C019|nr:CorA family divalent cation transporter [Phenylobacterium sp.]THD63907.1 MAG: hypothetical protein E8A49_04330 [Phenylobacterium sp.]
MIRTFLYDAQGHDQEMDLGAELPKLEEHHLLWIDVTGREPADFERLASLLDLKPRSVSDLVESGRRFSLANYGAYIQFDVATLESREATAGAPSVIRSQRLDVALGQGWVLTAHENPLRFLEEFRDQDRGETLIGGLTSAALAASLLDWHLATYLAALEVVEAFADRVDLRMLSSSRVREDLLKDLVGARRHISSLRRSLASQSSIFYGLSRPDLALTADASAVEGYKDLERRFERVLDSLEHGRELVQSSFDLFTTRTAETTNALIRRLTFISILLGALGGVAGVFGMNFETPYAKTGLMGFWAVVGAFLVLGGGAALIGRARKWI